MKRCVLSAVLVAMFLPTAALCQEFEHEVERKMAEMELRGRDMELQRMQEKAEAERRLLDLELEKRKIDIERGKREIDLDMGKRKMDLQMGQRKIDLEMGKRKMEMAHMAKGPKFGPHCKPLLLLMLVVHILVAVWVYQDIRQRNCGSGIWIAIALLTGLLGTLVYAVVRVGDSNGNKKKA
ncbi:MAG: hypothetical protein JSU70_04005 [Phycisphaerales bacterium]|nr:MAG: hypothetical protein JSU70_04005 [Phycisphaerales bacterium]